MLNSLLRMQRRLWLVPLALALLYGLYVFAMYEGQDRSIFAGAFRQRPTVDDLPPPARRITLTAADGLTLVAWYQAGEGRSAARPGPAVIFFHGNLDIVSDRWYIAQRYAAEGLSCLIFEYRGYGGMGGRPTERALIADAVQWVDWLAAQPEVVPGRIILHGNSLGGGVAVQAAAQRTPAAMVLESTFTSIAALSVRLGLPPQLCKHPFRSDELIPTLDVPMLIVHGRKDWVIPVSHGRRLRALARRATYVETEQGHADYRTDWPAIWEFLKANALLPK